MLIKCSLATHRFFISQPWRVIARLWDKIQGWSANEATESDLLKV